MSYNEFFQIIEYIKAPQKDPKGHEAKLNGNRTIGVHSRKRESTTYLYFNTFYVVKINQHSHPMHQLYLNETIYYKKE